MIAINVGIFNELLCHKWFLDTKNTKLMEAYELYKHWVTADVLFIYLCTLDYTQNYSQISKRVTTYLWTKISFLTPVCVQKFELFCFQSIEFFVFSPPHAREYRGSSHLDAWTSSEPKNGQNAVQDGPFSARAPASRWLVFLK